MVPIAKNNTNLIPGILLIVGAVAVVAGLFTHPPGEGESEAATFTLIQNEQTMWILSHALFGMGFLLIATAGVTQLFAGSRLVRGTWTAAGWALTVVASIPAALLAIVESTAVVETVQANNAAAFSFWYTGLVVSVFVYVLPLLIAGWALVALGHARTAGAPTPAWASWIAFAFAVLTLLAPLGLALELQALGVGFLGFAVPALWFGWMGVAFVRGVPEGSAAATTTRASTRKGSAASRKTAKKGRRSSA